MAHVHYAQEKYKPAETYAGRALSVNKCSSIACTQLALVRYITLPITISSMNFKFLNINPVVMHTSFDIVFLFFCAIKTFIDIG